MLLLLLKRVFDLVHWKSAGRGLAMVLPASMLVKQRTGHQFPGAQRLSGNRGSVSPALPCVRVKGRSWYTYPLLTSQHWSHTSSPRCCLIYFRLICKLSFRITSVFGLFNSLPMREKRIAQAASLTSHLTPCLPRLFPPAPASFKPVLPPL